MAEKITFNKIADRSGIKKGFEELGSILDNFAKKVEAFDDKISKAISFESGKVADLARDLESLKKALDKTSAGSDKGTKDIKDLGDEVINTGKKFAEAKSNLDTFKKSQVDISDKLSKAKEEAKRLRDEYSKLSDQQKQDKSEELSRKISELKDKQKGLQDELKNTRKGLNKANKGLKEAGKELDDIADGFDSVGDSAKEAGDTVGDIPKQTKPARDSIKGIKEEIKALVKEREELSQSQDADRSRELAGRLGILRAELKRLSDQTKAADRSLGGINETIDFQANTVNGIRKNIKLYRQQLNDAEIGTEQYLRAEAALNNELEKEIAIREKQPSLLSKRIRQAAGESKEVKELTDKLRKLRGELADPKTDFSTFKKIRAEIKKTEAEIDSVLTKSKKQESKGGIFSSFFGGITEGLAFGGAAGVGAKAVELVTEGISRFAEVIQEVTPQLRDLQTITGLSGDALTDLAGASRAISETFEEDFERVSLGLNALNKNFGGDPLDNARLLSQALVFDTSGEAIDSIKEYSVQLAGLGATAEDTVKLAQLQSREGFFSDKLFDAVKEAGLRLGDLSQGGKDALTSLGPLGLEIQDKFAKGERFEAIQLLSEGVSELGKQGKNVTPIIANLFGGAGEDLGLKGFEVLGNLENINIELTDLQRQQLELLESRTAFEQSLTSLVSEFSSSGNSLSIFINNLKREGIDILRGFIRFLKEVGSDISNIFSFLSKGSGGFAKIFQSIRNFSPILFDVRERFRAIGRTVTLIIDLFKQLIAFGSALNQSLGDPISKLASGVSNLFDTISMGFSDFRDNFSRGFDTLVVKAREAITKILGTVFRGIEFLRERSDFLSAILPEDAQERFGKFVNGFKKRYQEVLDELNKESIEPEVDPTVNQEAKKNIEAKLSNLNIKVPVKAEVVVEEGSLEAISKEISDLEGQLRRARVLGNSERIKELRDRISDLKTEQAFLQSIVDDNFKLRQKLRLLELDETGKAFQEAKEREKNEIEDQHKKILKNIEEQAEKQAEIDEKRQQRREFAFNAVETAFNRTQDKLESRIEADFSRRRQLLEEQNASSEAIAKLEAQRQRRLAFEAIKRAAVETLIASLRNGDSFGEASAKAGQASFLAGVAAFEHGGLVRGSEQIIRINEKGPEYVTNADATRDNMQLLEVINSGASKTEILNHMVRETRSLQPSPTISKGFKIDYDKFSDAVAKKIQKVDVKREAGMIKLIDELDAFRKIYVIKQAKRTPKFGDK